MLHTLTAPGNPGCIATARAHHRVRTVEGSSVTDLVEKLHTWAAIHRHGAIPGDILIEAADEIERLRADLRTARPYGCVCPTGAEASCQGLQCPRRSYGWKIAQ